MATDDLHSKEPRLWRKEATRDRHVHTHGSYFEWIERTDNPEFEEIRQRVSSLWLRVPEAQRAEYKARLRSNRCTDFFSAYNELWYHDALKAGGLRCFAPENTSAGSLPDWQLTTDQGPVAIAECYLRMQPEKGLRDDFVQRCWFDAAFKKLKNKRIRLCIHKRVCGAGQPNAGQLAKQLDALAESSSVEKNLGSVLELGRHRYEENESGWQLEFTMIVLQSASSDSTAQLLYFQSGGVHRCQGEKLFEAALSRKARQHSSTLPVVVCVGWNYFEHEPDFEEVCQVVAKKASSSDNRGVIGVFWAREVYPWNSAPAPPRLLHWGSTGIAPLLGSWKGGVVDVR